MTKYARKHPGGFNGISGWRISGRIEFMVGRASAWGWSRSSLNELYASCDALLNIVALLDCRADARYGCMSKPTVTAGTADYVDENAKVFAIIIW